MSEGPDLPLLLGAVQHLPLAHKKGGPHFESIPHTVLPPALRAVGAGGSLHLDSRLTKIGTGSLNIKEVRPQDAGTYQCRAQNSEDSIDSAAILEVLRPPTFVQQPQNTVALEKGDVTLDCEVAGHPQPVVQWYKNGDLIIESEYFQMVGGQSLKILGLVGLDAGIYQCVATNIAGNVQSAAELRVMKKLGMCYVLLLYWVYCSLLFLHK